MEMNNNRWKVTTIFLLVIVLVIVVLDVIEDFNLNDMEEKLVEDNVELYQGPVQEGYDEQVFRETGIHKKIEVEE